MGELPFTVAYGTEAVLPMKISMPTIRTLAMPMMENDGLQLAAKIDNDEGVLRNLDLLEEVREQSLLRHEAY